MIIYIPLRTYKDDVEMIGIPRRFSAAYYGLAHDNAKNAEFSYDEVTGSLILSCQFGWLYIRGVFNFALHFQLIPIFSSQFT